MRKNTLIPLKTIIDSLPLSNDELEYDQWGVGLEEFEKELDTGTYLGWSKDFCQRVRCHPVHTWLCTDTMVGVFAYYFDGNFIALSFQSARKDDVEFRWVSKEAAIRVKDFIRELDRISNDLKITTIDPEEKISEWWLTRGKD